MSHVDEGTLHGYLDGELAPEEARGVAAHLAQCPACRNRLDEERALIARAGELLALATPPDREIPPFRAGDLKPPPRLWWKVRLPLAWAATVVLALGIGMHLGGGATMLRVGRPATEGSADLAARVAHESTIAPETTTAKHSEPRPAPQRPRKAPASPPPSLAALERQPVDAAAPRVARVPSDTVAALITRDSVRREAARAEEGILFGARAESAPPPLSLDSARTLLGQEPVAIPDLPIRAMRRERAIGEMVVVIEQALDSATVIELRERRPVPMGLDAVVVTSAAESRAPEEPKTRDSMAARKARLRAAAPQWLLRADSLPALRPAEGRIVQEQDRPVLHVGNLRVEISGPLPADSLKRLLERARPVKP